MPPQSTGFRYTPPSYLLRTSQQQEHQQLSKSTTELLSKRGEENRPWKSSDETEEAAMRQEDRPVRCSTNMDAQFQHRVQKKQNRYRNILKGEEEPTPDNEETSSFDAAMASEVEAIAALQERQQVQQAAQQTQQAREARKQRISGAEKTPDVALVKKLLEQNSSGQTETVRSLRAQRLRTSLLQRSPEEVDVQTKLESRRKAQQEADRLAQQQEEERATQQQDSLERERKRLQEERDALEQAKREAAYQLANQWRQAQARHPVRQFPSEDSDSLEEMMEDKPVTPKRASGNGKKKTRRAARRKASRMSTGSLEEPDFAFLEDWGAVLRESGLLHGCVGQCFGVEDQVLVPSSEDSTSSGNPSLPELTLQGQQHAQRLNVYAQYRE